MSRRSFVTSRHIAARLPDIATLRRRCQAVAMLDAIVCPHTWDHRHHRYIRNWAGGASCAQLRNGAGDDCAIVFTVAGALIRGFDHESPMTPWRTDPPRPWPGLADAVPAAFRGLLTQPAFAVDGVLAATYLLWRGFGDAAWQTSPVNIAGLGGLLDPEGAHEFLDLLLDPTPTFYRDFARWNFDITLDPVAVAHIYNLQPLDEEVVRTLNPSMGLADIAGDIAASGYPRRVRVTSDV